MKIVNLCTCNISKAIWSYLIVSNQSRRYLVHPGSWLSMKIVNLYTCSLSKAEHIQGCVWLCFWILAKTSWGDMNGMNSHLRKNMIYNYIDSTKIWFITTLIQPFSYFAQIHLHWTMSVFWFGRCFNLFSKKIKQNQQNYFFSVTTSFLFLNEGYHLQKIIPQIYEEAFDLFIRVSYENHFQMSEKSD